MAFSANVPLTECARQVAAQREESERSFYILDLEDIKYKVQLWNQSIPRAKPHYAVKCNDNPAVLRVLANSGVNFDCASKMEIMKVLSLGVKPHRIIYAHPVKNPSYLKFARQVGVTRMTFDTLDELYKIKEIYPEAELVLRIKVDDHSAKFKLGVKFGCPEEHTETLLELAKELNLNVIGVSFHVGSFNDEPIAAYTAALMSARRVCDQGIALGYNMKLVDIGGGWPGYLGCHIPLEKIATVINRVMDKHFPARLGYEIISEPGTYFVASAFTLFTRIIGKKRLPEKLSEDEGPVEIQHYFVNDSIYNSFNICFFGTDCIVPIAFEHEDEEEQVEPAIIWGNTCDGVDKIKPQCSLPQMKVGEWLMFENLGAYSTVLETSFNSFEHPEVFFRGTEPSLELIRDLLDEVELESSDSDQCQR